MRTNRELRLATLILSAFLLGACTPPNEPTPPSGSNARKAVVEIPDEKTAVIASTEETEVVEEESMDATADTIRTKAGEHSRKKAYRTPASAGSTAQPPATTAPVPEHDTQVETATKPAAAVDEAAAEVDQAPAAPDQIATAAEGAGDDSGPGFFTILLLVVLTALGLTAPMYIIAGTSDTDRSRNPL